MTSKPENQTLANLFQFMTFDEIAEMYNVSKDTVIKWKTTMTKDINFDFFKILKEKITSIQSDYENIMTNTRLTLIRDLNISPISIFFFDKEKKFSFSFGIYLYPKANPEIKIIATEINIFFFTNIQCRNKSTLKDAIFNQFHAKTKLKYYSRPRKKND